MEGHRNTVQLSEEIQKELDAMMEVLEEVQDKIPEGAYLRGMNALGALHKHKRTTMITRRPGETLQCWTTLDEIEEENEEVFEEIMEVADNIIMELYGDEATIYTGVDNNLVDRGEEKEIFDMLMNYKPEQGNAGYETSPMVLHHALQFIMGRIFDDTYHELEIVRPVTCRCGWRGAQGNWDRHVSNARHQRWVVAERERKSMKRLTEAREMIVARREPGIVYLRELHSTPETKIATEEAIYAAESSGNRVVFICADGTMSWFA
jgi:hypothetical protein